jgi:probable DNA metabolism protein
MNEQLQLIPELAGGNRDVQSQVSDLDQLVIPGDPVAREIFRREVSLALLNKSPNKYIIIDKAIEQAKTKGISFVLCKVSDEARKFMKLAREVGAEKYRATSFIRLTPIDRHKVLFGEFETRHQTAELIMLHFMRRFPRFNIMIVFGEDVYIGRDNEIYKEKIDRKKIELPKETDEYEKYWLAFYRSQFIPERKNLRYLKRMIPKKYWKWVTELAEFGLA